MPKNLVLCFEGYQNQKSQSDTYPLHNMEAFLARSDEQLIFYPTSLNKVILKREDLDNSLKRACNFLAQHFKESDKIFIFATGNGINLASDLVTFLSTFGFYQEGDAAQEKKAKNIDLIERYSRVRIKNKEENQTMHYGLLSRVTKGSTKPAIQFVGYLGFAKSLSEASSFTESEVFEGHPNIQRGYFFITGQTGVIKSERNLQIKTEIDLERAVNALKSAAQNKGLAVLEEPHPNSLLVKKEKLGESSRLLSEIPLEKKKGFCTLL